MEKNLQNCPNGHGPMVLKMTEKAMTFRGEEIGLQAEVFICEKCELEVATVEQTAAIQNAMADAYRKKTGLFTGAEIREQRERLNLSQIDLAKQAGVGIASIKRWENGIIQTKSMNTALKAAFQNIKVGNNYTGNRALVTRRTSAWCRHDDGVRPARCHEVGSNELVEACHNLLDDINDRHGDKERAKWRCPFLQRISDLIGYE